MTQASSRSGPRTAGQRRIVESMHRPRSTQRGLGLAHGLAESFQRHRGQPRDACIERGVPRCEVDTRARAYARDPDGVYAPDWTAFTLPIGRPQGLSRSTGAPRAAGALDIAGQTPTMELIRDDGRNTARSHGTEQQGDRPMKTRQHRFAAVAGAVLALCVAGSTVAAQSERLGAGTRLLDRRPVARSPPPTGATTAPSTCWGAPASAARRRTSSGWRT